MTTKTRADLITEVLENLMVIAAGETADSVVYNAVDAHVDPALEELSILKVQIPDDEAIPLALFGSLADYIVENACNKFGRPANPQAKLAALNQLRLLTRGQPTREPQQQEYF